MSKKSHGITILYFFTYLLWLVQSGYALKCDVCLGKRDKEGDPLVCKDATLEEIRVKEESDQGILGEGVKTVKMGVSDVPNLCANVSKTDPLKGASVEVMLRVGIKKEDADLRDLLDKDKLEGCHDHPIGTNQVTLCFCATDNCNGNGRTTWSRPLVLAFTGMNMVAGFWRHFV